jgi:hypothetical protein
MHDTVKGQAAPVAGGAQAARSGAAPAWLARLGLPVRVGLGLALAGIILAIVGIIRGNVPLNPLSVFLALLISGGSWGVVSWAVATAAVDVENEVAEAEADE